MIRAALLLVALFLATVAIVRSYDVAVDGAVVVLLIGFVVVLVAALRVRGGAR